MPDEDVLLAAPPEVVGKALLTLAAESLQNGLFSTGAVAGPQNLCRQDVHGQYPCYSNHRSSEIELAVAEAWLWLEHSLLIMPAPQPNVSFKVLTRRGQRVSRNAELFDSYANSLGFPKSLLHEKIADDVWLQLAQGNLAVAVFVAFRAVEEAVRLTCGYKVTEVGVPMMRRAFHKDNGPLTRSVDPEAEREALANLFAGAIGSYKNPHSHRSVELDANEAQEMVLIASHLLRIVDDRATKPELR